MGKVKVELNYNPYIMETTVKFNGRKPFVNSRVEKYIHSKLQDWVDEAPDILREEMNGYDFLIDFTGPVMDFEQLKRAFKKKGIVNQDGGVSLFHKREYESRHKKTEEIRALLKWLRENSNQHFDYNSFITANTEIFEEKYSIITVHMQGLSPDFLEERDISIVDVDSVEDLDANLSNIPIFIFVDEAHYHTLSNELTALKNKSVKNTQLFFLIKNTVSTDMVKRVIQDLGIPDPQIVSSPSEKIVEDYFYAYPVTERIIESVGAFDREIRTIGDELAQEAKQYQSSDQTINDEIDTTNRKIELLKKALDKFKGRDNIEIPDDIKVIKKELVNRVSQWKENKIKLNEDNAAKFADNYNNYLKTAVKKFVDDSNDVFAKTTIAVMKKYKKVYQSAKNGYWIVDTDSVNFQNIGWGEEINLRDSFLSIKEVKMVEPKRDIGELIFGGGQEKKKVKETTYYCSKWRKCASNYIKPIMDSLVQKQYEQLLSISEEVASQCISQLNEALRKEQQVKEHWTSQLSKEAHQLQEDNDWLSYFDDAVQEIQEVNYGEDEE